MSDHAKPGRPRIFGRYRGIHADDPLFSDDDPYVASHRSEPVEPGPAPLFRDEVIRPVERTAIMDDEPWHPAEHHRAKIVVSGLTMGVLALVMGWSLVSIFGGSPASQASSYASPSASPSDSASADPSVPVAAFPPSRARSGPAPIAPRPGGLVTPLSEPQSQDLRGVTQPVRPTVDHDPGDYPELTCRYLCTPTPRPTHRPPTHRPPSPTPSPTTPTPTPSQTTPTPNPSTSAPTSTPTPTPTAS